MGMGFSYTSSCVQVKKFIQKDQWRPMYFLVPSPLGNLFQANSRKSGHCFMNNIYFISLPNVAGEHRYFGQRISFKAFVSGVQMKRDLLEA